jgi:Asp-tRNA(Asn)/Glu-tRNA(Gln) amidotransferase A subunit family amidase
LTSEAMSAVTRALRTIDAWEPVVYAFAYLDPARAEREASAADTNGGPLVGVTLGVKDIFATADQPTEYGSSIYAGFQPRADAAVVAQLRAAGAVAMGKTVTTEFAVLHPGPTTNPHRVTHTPGGSSSGSAAAVACGMVDVALGTQTAGSVIRPASYCGVFGFKPTFARVTIAGVKLVAPSLDTVGWFARNVALLDQVHAVLTGCATALPLARPARIACVRTDQWDHADADAQLAFDNAIAHARHAGAEVIERDLTPSLMGLADAHPTLMSYELVRSLAWEQQEHADELSSDLLEILEMGRAVTSEARDEVRRRAAAGRAQVDDLLGDCDAVLTPAATGEAPVGLHSTGPPRFQRMWTLLGVPAVSVPGLTGTSGLPVGVQLIGRHDDDASLLAVAAWLADALPPPTEPALPVAPS